MKKANIQVNTIKKVVNINVEGRMTEEDSKIFVSEYNSKMRTINPADYTLEVDCSEMQILPQDMVEDLTNVMKLYKSSGFNKIIYKIKSSTTMKMQLTRIARNAGLTNYSIVVAN